MKLIANRQLCGDFGVVAQGESFMCHDEQTATSLLGRALARTAAPPRILYETKVIAPEAPEVGPRLPFRDLPLCHPQPAELAFESHRPLPFADACKPGTPDRVGRTGRA